VIITVAGAGADDALLAHMEQQGILAVGFGPGRVRLIPNLENSPADVARVVDALNSWPGSGN